MKDRYGITAGLEDYPTPVLADEVLDFWAEWYCTEAVAMFGVRFLPFLQNPVTVSRGLSDLMPTIDPPCPRERRLTARERFHVAEIIYHERRQAFAQ